MASAADASMMSPDTNTAGVIAVSVIGMLLPTMTVVGRIYARHLKAPRLYADDYFIVLALVFKFAIDIAGCILIAHGLGRHIGTVSPSDLVVFLKVQYTGVIFYPLCVTFTKLSILAQYKRIFAGRSFRYAVDALIAITVLWCISVCFTGIFLCTPIDKSWYPLKPGTCINLISFYYGLQIPNVLTDVVILVLPLKEVAGLKLPKDQKIGVAIACALWTLCLIFGIVRLVVMVQLESKGSDVTWTLVTAAIWTTIEPSVGIITACLPAVRIIYCAMVSSINRQVNASRPLRNPSESSGMESGQVLTELPRHKNELNYGECMREKEGFGADGKYSSTSSTPITPTSPNDKYAPLNS